MQEPSNPLVQNAYYNGWLSGCFASSLFVYDSFGLIIYAYLNAPGTQHDSTLACGLYHLLRKRTPAPFGLAADTAFSASGDLASKIWKPLTDGQLKSASNDESISVKKLCAMIKKHRAAVSIRQGAEWGMGGLQGVYRRLNLPLCVDHAKRQRLLLLVAHLWNFRVRTTGITQIGTVYSPNYMGNMNDNNAHSYYLQARDVNV